MKSATGAGKGVRPLTTKVRGLAHYQEDVGLGTSRFLVRVPILLFLALVATVIRAYPQIGVGARAG
jgi:hypothetical protein